MTYDIDTDTHTLNTTLTGKALLFHPLLNKGTAFSTEEREAFELVGKLPEKVENIDEQIQRVHTQLQRFDTQDARSIYLHSLFNTNEILFYAYVKQHILDVVSTLYTPTVGATVQSYSQEYRHPRGIYISANDTGNIEKILATRTNPEIDLIVISDGEGVLGIGDQGLGGIGIPVAKLVMYVVSGCCSPFKTLPIFIDVGTNNTKLLDDPMYLGLRQKRLNGDAYHQVVDEVVHVCSQLFPSALLHWEDFAKNAARRHLSVYEDKMACFNDDIQGTAVVVLAAIMTALKRKQAGLATQRIVIVGAGSAGMGIAHLLLAWCQREGMSEQEALDIFWIVDRYGLVMQGQTHIGQTELTFGRTANYHANWPDRKFQTVVAEVKPTILIGCSTVAGFFDEDLVKNLVAAVGDPIIMPLSNPSSRSEAHPHDIHRWSNSAAYIATGSPFAPYQDQDNSYPISQCNNLFAFPGIGAGMIAARAKKLTEPMLIAAAHAISEYNITSTEEKHKIMPDVADLEQVSRVVTRAVAKQAVSDGVARVAANDIDKVVSEHFWQPTYHSYRSPKELA